MKKIILFAVIGIVFWAAASYSETNSGWGSSSTGTSAKSDSSLGAADSNKPSSAGTSSASLGASDPSGSAGSALDFHSTGSIKISRIGEKAPSGMNSIAQGEITEIDQANHKVTVRDSTGSSVRYTLSDQKMLKDLNKGDRVQVFSDAQAQ